MREIKKMRVKFNAMGYYKRKKLALMWAILVCLSMLLAEFFELVYILVPILIIGAYLIAYEKLTLVERIVVILQIFIWLEKIITQQVSFVRIIITLFVIIIIAVAFLREHAS